jgi:hypothetical protein
VLAKYTLLKSATACRSGVTDRALIATSA